MADLQDLSQDRRLRNHFNIDKKRRTNRHRQSSPHFHSYYELYYMQEGSCKFFLLDSSYTLMRGDFLLVPPGAYHIVTYQEKGVHDRYALYFDEEKLGPDFSGAPPFFHEHSAPRHFRIRKEREEELLAIMGKMLELYRLDNAYGDRMLEFLFPMFLVFLSQHALPVQDRSADGGRISPVEAVTRHIAAHYAEPLTLEEAARIAGFTPTYFSRRFKETVGIGFRDYLTHMRLREGARLLRTTRLSVQEISQRCGFTGGNYFGDVFRSAYGVSPRQYRRGDAEEPEGGKEP